MNSSTNLTLLDSKTEQFGGRIAEVLSRVNAPTVDSAPSTRPPSHTGGVVYIVVRNPFLTVRVTNETFDSARRQDSIQELLEALD